MIVLMMYTNFYHYWATGPFFKDFDGDVDLCEDSWWANLLYINNFTIKSGYVRICHSQNGKSVI